MIRKKSAKRELQDELRRPFVRRILEQYPWCQACPVFAQHDELAVYTRFPSQDVHELIRRSQGGSVLDENNVLAVCRKCHNRIGNYPALAFDLGLAKRGLGL